MKFYLRSIAAILVASIIGCSTGRFAHSGIVDRLKNRGPVPLSPDNPYLAGNLFLSREMEQSAEIKGFVEHRGTPGAIEISQDVFSDPTMRFYYPENGEFFSFEYVDDTWLIEGPLSISTEKQRELKRATSGGKAALSTPSASPTQVQTKVTPSLTPLQNIQPFRSPPLVASPIPEVSAAIPTPDNSFITGLIEKSPKNDAEISPKGDLVHYVTFPGETLEIISKWYTFDETNAGRLARLNKIQLESALSPGDTIIVPSYFVRNKIRLTQESLAELKKSSTPSSFASTPAPTSTPLPSVNDRRY